MAVDMFLKVDGIEGESQDEKHAKEIDVLAWSWGMSQSGTMHAGGGGGAGKVAVQDVSVTKYVDASSNGLMSRLSISAIIASTDLTTSVETSAVLASACSANVCTDCWMALFAASVCGRNSFCSSC